MPRNRMIKIDFWEDEKTGNLSDSAKCLFIGMWNFADDEGLIRYSPDYLKSHIFVYSSKSINYYKKLMKELESANLIFPYQGKYNQKYAYIINFHKHQIINRPQKSKLPPPSLQSAKVKNMYFERDNMLCHLCNALANENDNPNQCNSKAPSIDHIIPKSKGGSDYPSNIKTAHLGCNKSKGDSLSGSVNDSVNDSGIKVKVNVKEKVKEKVKVNGNEKSDGLLNQIFNLWNEEADSNLPRCKVLNNSRIKTLKQTIKEYQDFETWKVMINKLNNSSFLAGKKSDFKATFDWFIQSKNLDKISDGNYEDNKKNKNPFQSQPEILTTPNPFLQEVKE